MTTHFEIFGLAPSPDVDVKALESAYRRLSLELHPDRNPDDRLRAAERSAALNEAFKVLKDPAKRAFYLLKLHGVDLEREEAGPQGRNLGLPMDFLEEILDRREALEEAKRAKDALRARRMGQQIQQELDRSLASAQKSLQTPDPPSVEAAKGELARVRYYQRFLEEVEAIEEAAL